MHECARCNKSLDVENGAPYIYQDNKYYCGDCAFIENIIDAKTLIKVFYYFIPAEIIGNPIIVDNKVEFVSDAYIKAKTNNNYRRTPEYYRWRKAVYERDNYTCQKCGTRGGNLNAHHIKPFSKNKELRTDINNGITLCCKCHKEVHGEKKCKVT